MKKLRIGLIGWSRRGSSLLKCLPANAELAAVADLDAKKLDRIENGVFKTADYHELLARKDVDAVVVATRDFEHETPAIDSMNASKTVFLEKPMSISVESCDRILDAAKRSGARLFLGHNMRYMPFVLKMKELIDAGAIGRVQAVWCRHFVSYGGCYFRHWCALRKNTNGLLLQKGAHDIDVIQWLAGARACRVVGMGRLSVYDKAPRRNPGEEPDRDFAFTDACWPPLEAGGLAPEIDIEDCNMLLMQLENGVQASYEQCFYTPDAERNYTFIGDRGRLENIGDSGACSIHVWTKRGSRAKPDIVCEVPAAEGSHGGADSAMMKAFVEYALEGVSPNTSPLAARDAVAAGCMGLESIRNGNIPMVVAPWPGRALLRPGAASA